MFSKTLSQFIDAEINFGAEGESDDSEYSQPEKEPTFNEQDLQNARANTQLMQILKEQVTSVIWPGSPDRHKHVELNAGALRQPYSFEDGYKEHIAKFGVDVAEAENLDTPPDELALPSKKLLEIPSLEQMPEHVSTPLRKYINSLLQEDECEDFPLWADKNKYTCDWYEEFDLCGASWVPSLADEFGYSALDACCVCNPEPATRPPELPIDSSDTECNDIFDDWTDAQGNTCNDYFLSPSLCNLTDILGGEPPATEVCCACGAEPVERQLEPETEEPEEPDCDCDCGDFEIFGAITCETYTAVPTLCNAEGMDLPNEFGVTAREACCVCHNVRDTCNPIAIPHSNSQDVCIGIEYGDVCGDFECDEGFERIGNFDFVCEDGRWPNPPECAKQTCPPPVIAHSDAFSECSDIAYGETCLFWSCDPNYKLTQSRNELNFYPTCIDGEWDELPSCELQDKCSPPPIINAVQESLEQCSGIPPGEPCFFQCNPGYQPTGFPVCAHDGEWDKLYRCDPIATCSDPGIPNSDANIRCAQMSPGYGCIFECDEGYKTSRDDFPECLPDGTWSFITYCEEKETCAIPPIEHSNAAEVCTDVAKNEYCIFECDDRYTLTGEALQCIRTQGEGLDWSEPFPSCEPSVYCPTPPNIINGDPLCDEVLAGLKCEIDCIDGFRIEGEDPICLENGEWGELPTCEEIPNCEPLQVAHSNSLEVCANIQHGSECRINCDEGYKPENSGSEFEVLCSDGSWQDAVPQCVERERCLSPQILNSNAGSICHDSPHGVLCEFQCDEGYELTGSDELICRDGNWDPNSSNSRCDLRQHCTVPAILGMEFSNVHEVCNELGQNEFCIFGCDVTHERTGSYPQCLQNVNGVYAWSINPNSPPGCNAIEMCQPPELPNSNSFSACENKRIGEYCEFKCNSGYERHGKFPRCEIANSIVQWKSPDPNELEFSCEEIPLCAVPIIGHTSHEKLSAECSQVREGTICQIQCDTGYRLEPPTFPICLDDGSWSEIVTCEEIKKCDEIQIVNSNFDDVCVDFEEGERCDDFACDPGYTMSGTRPTCEFATTSGDSLEWTNVPTCDPILTCMKPPSIPFSDSAKCSSTPHEEVCDFKCDEGKRSTHGFSYPQCILGEWTTNFENNELPECIKLTPEFKISYLDRQFFKFDEFGEAKEDTFFAFYDSAINDALLPKNKTADEMRELEEIAQRRRQIVETELPELLRNCTLKWDSDGEFLRIVFNSVEEYCDAMGVGSLETELEGLTLREESINHDPVQELKNKINEFKNDEKHSAVVQTGDGGFERKPNWISTPGPIQMFDQLRMGGGETVATVKYNISIDTNSFSEDTNIDIVEGEEIVTIGKTNFIAAYTNTSEFKTITYTESHIDIEVEMEFRRWGRVIVGPDDWYSPEWVFTVQAAENNGQIREGYTVACDPDECNGKIPLTGMNGLVYTKIAQLFVATDVSLMIKGNGQTVSEIKELWKEASSIRFGPICEGKACHTTGNVILGGDDLTDHGWRTIDGNIDGWLYIEDALLSLKPNTWRATSQTGTIAALGSADPGPNNYHEGNAGSAIMSAAEAAGLTVHYFDGESEIRRFFDELNSGGFDPQIIWIAGTDARSNNLDGAEGQALTDNALIIEEFASSGGGLLAHGYGDTAYGWLQALLPDIEDVSQCDASGAYLTDAGKEKFKQITNNDIRSGPCHNHFIGDFGNMEVLAYDKNDRPFIIGGHGGITRVEEFEDSGEETSRPEENVEGSVVTHVNSDVPQILLVYAPDV